MSGERKLEPRDGNQALDYLLTHHPKDAKSAALIELLPKLTDDLYSDAQRAAKDLLRSDTPNPVARIGKSFAGLVSRSGSTKQAALANSIFDLQLTAVFPEISEYVGNFETASLLVDALVYQATGCEARSPTSDEIFDAGTQGARGIHKFQLARKAILHIKDIEAWTFGKEYGAIVHGEPKDIAHIISVSVFSLIVRVRARWRARYVLYGTPPTKQDHDALDAAIRKQEKGLEDLVGSVTKGV